ncbi:restriction endonuclease subunit S [Microbacterium sp. NPDC016588]
MTQFVLGDLFDFSNGVNAGKDAYGSGIPFANVLEVIANEGLRVSDIPGRMSLSGDLIRRYQVRRGDVLFNRSSETQDEVGISSTYLDDAPIVFGGFVLRGRPKTAELVVEYSQYALRASDVRAQIIARGQGGIRANIGQRDLATVSIVVPDTEIQRTIAQRLDEAKELIRALERLIAKKRLVRQGIMQQLLTGRTRLPGFDQAWVTRRIGDFTTAKAGGTPSTAISRYWHGDVPWMSSGEIHQKRITAVRGRITQDGLRESAARLLPSGTVLMALAGQGKTRGTVAVSRIQLTTNQSIAGILPSPTHDPDFLYYNLDTRYEELRGESTGDGGRGGLNLTIIKNLELVMPELDEQKAISAVLSDADDELVALERRLESARAVKQGMMQELLSGRTRLTEGAAA